MKIYIVTLLNAYGVVCNIAVKETEKDCHDFIDKLISDTGATFTKDSDFDTEEWDIGEELLIND